MSSIPFDTSGVFIGGVWRRLRQRRDAAAVQPVRRQRCWRRSRAAPRPTSTPPWPPRRPRSTAPWGQLTRRRARPRAARACRPQVLEQADELARLEALDVGKPLKQGRADARGAGALPRVLRRRGRQGDGRDHPLRQRLHRADAARAARRHRPHRAVELPDADHRPLGRCGAGHGQCLRAEAGRGGLPDRAGLRAHRATRPACRRAR